MSKYQEYVAGFAIDRGDHRVALIQKNRPEWQAGKLNGIGGHIEDGETPHQAMVREFAEEAGVKTNGKDWRKLVTLSFKGGRVWFFVTEAVTGGLKTTTDEKVGWYDLDTIPALNTIPNLRWLVPLAFDKDKVHGDMQEAFDERS